MRPILIVMGTRPEGIKMIPLYWALKQQKIPVILCSTSQHSDLLQKVFQLFNVQPDIELNIMKAQQDLFYITETILHKMQELLRSYNPWAIAVQGDTTTAMASALAAFYHKIPIIHIEAGLRTPTIYNPFPEEMNRRFISQIATYHFAPTFNAAANLLAQNTAPENVFCTGNTSIDALRIVQEKIVDGTAKITPQLSQLLNKIKHPKIVLFTMHRRESLTEGIAQTLKTIKKILDKHHDVIFIFPLHPNPLIAQAIDESGIRSHHRMHILEPLDYHDLIYLMKEAFLIMTDSGGMQEEAAALGKYTLVLRESTERIESIQAGFSCLVGTDEYAILTAFDQIHTHQPHLNYQDLYGDGYAAQRIAHIIATKYQPFYFKNVAETLVTKEVI